LQLENRGNLEEWEVKLRQNRYDMLRESGLIVNQISDALSAMEAARRRAEYHHEALLDLQHLVQAERERLRLGASDLLTVNLREQMAAEEEIELIEAVADHRKALADYKHAIGQWSIPGFDQSWLNAIEKEFTWNPS
jgi:outer membrane protein TolC